MLQAFKSLLVKLDLLTLGDLLFLSSTQRAGAWQSPAATGFPLFPTEIAHQYSAFSIKTNLGNLVSGCRGRSSFFWPVWPGGAVMGFIQQQAGRFLFLCSNLPVNHRSFPFLSFFLFVLFRFLSFSSSFASSSFSFHFSFPSSFPLSWNDFFHLLMHLSLWWLNAESCG